LSDKILKVKDSRITQNWKVNVFKRSPVGISQLRTMDTSSNQIGDILTPNNKRLWKLINFKA